MLIMTSIIRVGQTPLVLYPIDNDSYDRIMTNLQSLAVMNDRVSQVYLSDCKKAYARLIEDGRVGVDGDVDGEIALRILI